MHIHREGEGERSGKIVNVINTGGVTVKACQCQLPRLVTGAKNVFVKGGSAILVGGSELCLG